MTYLASRNDVRLAPRKDVQKGDPSIVPKTILQITNDGKDAAFYIIFERADINFRQFFRRFFHPTMAEFGLSSSLLKKVFLRQV